MKKSILAANLKLFLKFPVEAQIFLIICSV